MSGRVMDNDIECSKEMFAMRLSHQIWVHSQVVGHWVKIRHCRQQVNCSKTGNWLYNRWINASQNFLSFYDRV